MANHRPYVTPTSKKVCLGIPSFLWCADYVCKALLKNITARLYPALRRAISVPVPSRCSSTKAQDARLPFVENVMGHHSLQPYVHDVVVYVHHQAADGLSTTSKFQVFFKRHVHLPHNEELDLKGDVVVMRVASRNQLSVVNMRRSDTKIADFIVTS
jgi:hypothetical protein